MSWATPSPWSGCPALRCKATPHKGFELFSFKFVTSESRLIQVREAHKNDENEEPVTKSQAEIQFINKISKLQGYGVEYFSAETMDRTSVVIGVHSEGLQILSKERDIMDK